MTNQELLSLCNKRLNYNPDTGVFTWRKRVSPRATIGDIAGSVNVRGYTKIKICRKLYFAHRLAFLMSYHHLPEFIDHKNRDRSDNRILNLRECTQLQNQKNRGLTIVNKSGYKGVSWHKSKNRWRAGITVDGESIHLGSFTCKHEAAKAYNEAALKYHGEFAYLNVILNTPNMG